jgi:hypothetical protein
MKTVDKTRILKAPWTWIKDRTSTDNQGWLTDNLGNALCYGPYEEFHQILKKINNYDAIFREMVNFYSDLSNMSQTVFVVNLMRRLERVIMAQTETTGEAIFKSHNPIQGESHD